MWEHCASESKNYAKAVKEHCSVVL